MKRNKLAAFIGLNGYSVAICNIFKIRLFLMLGIALTIVSCGPSEKKGVGNTNETSEKLVADRYIDTAKEIANLKIVETVDKQHLIAKDNKKNLKGNVVTIDLMYVAYACDCPSWVDPIEYNRVYEHNYGERDDSGEDYVEFNKLKYGFYIEPADSGLIVDDRLFVFGNTIRFVGREYNEVGYPDNGEFMDPNPPKGKVFRYYSYQILRPYKVGGPVILLNGTMKLGR